jgi:hypothetical protein
VRPERIVFQPPFFNQHLGLLQGIEDLAVEPVIPEFTIEALVVTVLPGTTRKAVDQMEGFLKSVDQNVDQAPSKVKEG